MSTPANRANVVEEYRPRVLQLVRSVDKRLRREAAQAAWVGVLMALDRFDPTRQVPFWCYAERFARYEIQKWLEHEVYWQPRDRRKGADGEDARARRRAAELPEDVWNNEALSAVDLIEESQNAACVRAFLEEAGTGAEKASRCKVLSARAARFVRRRA